MYEDTIIIPKKLPDKEIVLRFLKRNANQWFHVYELMQHNTVEGFMPHSADRHCRFLYQDYCNGKIIDGKIEKKKEENKILYRFVHNKPEQLKIEMND